MTAETRIRAATATDFPLLVHFRCEMFRDMGWHDESRLQTLAPLYEAYLREHFSAGDFVAWIAEDDGGGVIGAVGLLWERVPPTVRNLTGKQAYVLALYVVPPRRRQGVARALAKAAVDFATEEGAAVIALHSSWEGRGLYESLGFSVSPEMRMFTDPGSAHWTPVPDPGGSTADDS